MPCFGKKRRNPLLYRSAKKLGNKTTHTVSVANERHQLQSADGKYVLRSLLNVRDHQVLNETPSKMDGRKEADWRDVCSRRFQGEW